MKKILVLGLAILLGASCKHGGKAGTNTQQEPGKLAASVFPVAYAYEQLEGVYSGDFGGSVIHMTVRKVTGRNAVGYTVHKGLKRNFSGMMEPAVNGFHFVLKEPGNNPYDGIFDIVIDTIDFGVNGNWTPKNATKAGKQVFRLERNSKFKNYAQEGDPTPRTFYDSSSTLSFKADGLCTYAFYPDDPNAPNNQLVTIRGNWVLKDNAFNIEWEKNNVMPNRTCILKPDTLKIDTFKDVLTRYYYELELTINGRRLSNTRDK